jgi:hypothetical protein
VVFGRITAVGVVLVPLALSCLLGFAIAVAPELAVLVTAGAVVLGFIVTRPARATLLLLLLLPFFFYPATVGKFSIFVGLPLFLVAALALVAATADLPRRRLELPVLAFGALLTLGIVAAAQAENPLFAHSRLAYLLAFALVAWALARAIQGGLLGVEQVVGALVAGAAVAAIALEVQFIAQFVVGSDRVFEWLDSVYPAFGGGRAAEVSARNWYIPSLDLVRGIFPFMAAPSAGQYMMMSLVAGLWLLRRPLSVRSHLLLRIALALIAGGLLVTFSRQAWVGAVVGAAVLVFPGKGRRSAVAAVAVVGVVAFVPLPYIQQTAASYLTEAIDVSTSSSSQRLGLWGEAAGFVEADPLSAGVGPGLYVTAVGEQDQVYYAHNMFLDAAVEMGIFGALALLAVLALGIRAAWRNSRLLALPLLAAFVTANLFDDVLYFPRNGIPLALAFALAALRERATASEPAAPAPIEGRTQPASA